MTVRSLQLDAPHISVEVWAGVPVSQTFTGMCRVVRQMGYQPTGWVVIAPSTETFRFRTDLPVRFLTPVDVGDRFNELVANPSADQLVRAGFRSTSRSLVVQYGPAPLGGDHPVQATLSGEELGIPEDLWDDEERAAGLQLAQHIKELFIRATAETSALYGHIGYEADLPTPEELEQGQPLGNPIFVSESLLTAAPELLPRLRRLRDRDQETRLPSGVVFDGWGATREDGGPTVRAQPDVKAEVSELIGVAVKNHAG